MKKIIFGTIIMAVIGGYFILKQPTLQKANIFHNSEFIKNDIYLQEYQLSYGFSRDDVDKMYKHHEFIAIVKIDKLRPAATYRENIDEYILPFTPGDATVLNVLKGNFKSEKISFIRLGGTVPFSEYEKSFYEEARSKFNETIPEKKKSTMFVKNMAVHDIEIEEGKTYLVYMNRSDEFHEKNEYTIEAFEYGLREISMTKSDSKNLDLQTISIKNNKTGEFEALNIAVSKMITKNTPK